MREPPDRAPAARHREHRQRPRALNRRQRPAQTPEPRRQETRRSGARPASRGGLLRSSSAETSTAASHSKLHGCLTRTSHVKISFAESGVQTKPSKILSLKFSTDSQDRAWEGWPRCTSEPGAAGSEAQQRTAPRPAPTLPRQPHFRRADRRAGKRCQGGGAPRAQGPGSCLLAGERQGRGECRTPTAARGRAPPGRPGGRLGAAPACAGRSLRQQPGHLPPSLPPGSRSGSGSRSEAGRGQRRPGAGQWEKGSRGGGRRAGAGAGASAAAGLHRGAGVSDRAPVLPCCAPRVTHAVLMTTSGTYPSLTSARRVSVLPDSVWGR